MLDPSGIAISTGGGDKLDCALAHGPSNSLLMAYDSFVPQPYGSARIWGNLSQYPTPVAFAGGSISDAAGCVRLSWRMALEASVSSFVVERSDSPDGGFQPLEIPITEGAGEAFSCLDCSVVPGGTYWYRIFLKGAYGSEVYGPLQVHVAAVPLVYALDRAFPNPFNPSCRIGYEIPRVSRVSLRVFDVGGSLARTLVEGWREPGVYSEVWDGRRDDGSSSPSGVYLYRLEAGDFVATRKMILLR